MPEYRRVTAIQPREEGDWKVTPYTSLDFNRPYVALSVNFPLEVMEKILRVLNTNQVLTGEVCSNCGGVLVRSGTCYSCTQCGETTGCG